MLLLGGGACYHDLVHIQTAIKEKKFNVKLQNLTETMGIFSVQVFSYESKLLIVASIGTEESRTTAVSVIEARLEQQGVSNGLNTSG